MDFLLYVLCSPVARRAYLLQWSVGSADAYLSSLIEFYLLSAPYAGSICPTTIRNHTWTKNGGPSQG